MEPTEEHIGKGRPTPSRKEAQARNAQPLIGAQSKEARKAQRQRIAEDRARARIGLAQGDDRYLSTRDRGPQRRWVRDYVDARFNIGEFLMPVMLIVLITTFLPSSLRYYGVFVLWLAVLFTVLDIIIMNVGLGKKLKAKFGAENLQKGWRWYAGMRMVYMRFLRLPKPRVRRGDFPE